MKKEHKIEFSIQSISKSMCCACAACEAICPVKAIAIILDENGFYYPQVEPKKCIDCGKCLQVCVFSQ